MNTKIIHIDNSRESHARRALKPLQAALIEEGSTKANYLPGSTLRKLRSLVIKASNGDIQDYHIKALHYFHRTLRDKVKEAISSTDNARAARSWLKDIINNIEIIEVPEYSPELDNDLKATRNDKWYILSVKTKEVAA